MQIIASIVKPLATLIITRRLYHIVNLRSEEPLSNVAVRALDLHTAVIRQAQLTPRRRR